MRLSLQWSTLPLSDNHDMDEYEYEVDVVTSTKKGAGTTSNVYIIVVGDEGDSGIRQLKDGQRKVSHFVFLRPC